MRRPATGRLALLVPRLSLLLLLILAGCGHIEERPPDRLDRLGTLAGEARDRLLRETDPDGASPSPSLAALDQILDYVDRVRAEPNRFDPAEISEYARKIEIINDNIKRFRDDAFRAEITFPKGGYRPADLPDTDRARLDQLADHIHKTVFGLSRQHPGYPVRITIKTIGFTDALPVITPSLERRILARLADPMPLAEDRRRQYNRVLSRFRSAGLNDGLVRRLRRDPPAGVDVEIVQTVLGRGEHPPDPAPTAAYAPDDERRRICRVHAYIELVP